MRNARYANPTPNRANERSTTGENRQHDAKRGASRPSKTKLWNGCQTFLFREKHQPSFYQQFLFTTVFHALQKENIEVEQAQVEEVNKKEDWMALYEKVAAARGEM